MPIRNSLRNQIALKFDQICVYVIGCFRSRHDREGPDQGPRGSKNGQKESHDSRFPSYPFAAFLSPNQGLVGEKYGSIRVPGEVESAEFEMILDAAVEAGLDTQILEEWYCRDENAVPPAYYLKPKAQMLKNFQNSVSPLVL